MRFVETPVFTAALRRHLDDDEYRALQIALVLRPAQGVLIRGGAGLRKLRWKAAGRGKRGGLAASRAGARRPGGIQMKDAAFRELLKGVRQAGQIHRGERKASRVTLFKPADVKAIRAKLGQSQEEFALMIGVSVATLRNWEQGRRTPDGPALALLRVTSKNPRAVADALRGSRRGAA